MITCIMLQRLRPITHAVRTSSTCSYVWVLCYQLGWHGLSLFFRLRFYSELLNVFRFIFKETSNYMQQEQSEH